MAKKVKSKKKPILKKIGKNSEIPATHGQLEAVRVELKSGMTSLSLRMHAVETKIDSVEARLDSKIDAVSAKIDAVESRLDAKIDAVEARLDAKIDAVEARLNAKIDAVSAKIDAVESRLEAKIEQVLTAVYSIKVVVEEQNAKNAFVMDGLRSVVDVQQDLIARIQRLEKATFGVEN